MTIVTIKDVAARAGVSAKTVSRVINGEPHVRDAVREAVQRVVAELDYRPNAFARSLSSSRSYLIGLLLDDPGSGYAADVQLGALMRCRTKSYHLVVEPLDTHAPGWAAELSGSLRALKLDGAILTPPVCDDPRVLDLLEAEGLPYVRISPRGDFARSGLVRMDDHAAAQEMTEQLLALGHREIGFIRGDPNHSASQAREAGYRAALAAAKVPVRERLVVDGDFSFRSGLSCGNALLGARRRPTAIFASNDDMALGVLMAAIKRGVAVPESLSIVGFDDAPSARLAWPLLTTVRQPKAEMAAAAVDILVDPSYRSGGAKPGYRQVLQYQLVLRESAAAAPVSPAS
jgi:LacI family transcriptional regulator